MKKAFLSLALFVSTLSASAQYFDRPLAPDARINVTKNTKGETVSVSSIKFDRETGAASCVIEFDRPAADLYLYSRIWFADYVFDYQKNKQMEDNKYFILISNSKSSFHTKSVKLNQDVTHKGTQSVKLTLRCKEGRIRLQVSDYSASYSDNIISGGQYQSLKEHRAENFKIARGWISPEYFDSEYIKFLNFMVEHFAYTIIKQDNDNDF